MGGSIAPLPAELERCCPGRFADTRDERVAWRKSRRVGTTRVIFVPPFRSSYDSSRAHAGAAAYVATARRNDR
jgi:hypothetical protein